MKTIRSKFTYDNIVFWFGIMFLIASSLLTGCSSDSVQHAQEQYTVQNLNYYQSDETKLCFAFQHDNGGRPVMTEVECTADVLRLVHKTAPGVMRDMQKQAAEIERLQMIRDLNEREALEVHKKFSCEVRSYDGVPYNVISAMDHKTVEQADERCRSLKLLFAQPLPRP